MGLSTAQVDQDTALVDEFDLDKLDFGDASDDDAGDAAAPEKSPESEAAAPEKTAESEVEKAAEPIKSEGEDTPTPNKAEPEGKIDDDAGKPQAGIPKHRFDFVQQKRREAEERAAALEAELSQLKKQPAQDTAPRKGIDEVLAEMDLQIAQATLDGDAEKVAQLRGHQRRIELSVIEQRAAQIGDQTVTQATEMQRLNEVIDKLESMYPQFVEGDTKYDKDLVDEVLDMHSAFVAKGTPPSQAMAKASAYVLRAHGMLGGGSAPPAEEKPAASAVKKTDVAKNVAAAKAQPPNLSNAGLDSGKAGVTKKVDLAHMTIEDFEKLGEKDLMEARGDFDV